MNPMNSAALMTAMVDKMEDGLEKLAALDVEEDAYLEAGDLDAAREVHLHRILLRCHLVEMGVL